jgi:UDP-glucose 4-epimerase
MAKILVTGGAGYIGSHVLKLLKDTSHEVVVVDNLSSGNQKYILTGKFIKADLRNKEALKEIFKNHHFDSVIHFAGSIIVPESVVNPLKYYDNNVRASLNLLECVEEFNIKYFIFSSTAAVYGLEGEGFTEEDNVKKPINPYGHSKLMIEQVIQDLSFAKKDFKFVILRYFNVAGADPDLETGQVGANSTHLIKVAMETALGKRKQMEIYGEDYDTADGSCVRDYIHVLDLAQAHLDALAYLEKGGSEQILNCGYSRGFSVKEVINTAKKVTGVDFKVVTAARRAGDAATLVSNNKKIRSILNWQPKYQDLEVIIRTAYQWEEKLQSN